MAFGGCLTGLRESDIPPMQGHMYFGIGPAELDNDVRTYERGGETAALGLLAPFCLVRRRGERPALFLRARLSVWRRRRSYPDKIKTRGLPSADLWNQEND